MVAGLFQKNCGLMILKICTRFSMHPRFYGYTYRDEFVADAVARCLSHSLDRIDLNHPNCNPFSYITQTAYNVFRQRIKNEKRYMLAKQNLRDKLYDEFERVEGIRSTHDFSNDENDEMNNDSNFYDDFYKKNNDD